MLGFPSVHKPLEFVMERLPTFKRKITDLLLAGLDAFGMITFASGAAAVAFLGKVMRAVVLAAIALGCFLRLTNRRRVHVAVPAPLPAWIRAAAAGSSLVVVGVLVEATNLPVRFDQTGFEAWHWVLVAVALAVAYSLFSRVFRSVGQSRQDAVTGP